MIFTVDLSDQKYYYDANIFELTCGARKFRPSRSKIPATKGWLMVNKGNDLTFPCIFRTKIIYLENS